MTFLVSGTLKKSDVGLTDNIKKKLNFFQSYLVNIATLHPNMSDFFLLFIL